MFIRASPPLVGLRASSFEVQENVDHSIRVWNDANGASCGENLPSRAGTIMEHEAVAIRGEHEGDVERGGIVEALLHPVADAVGIQA